MWSAGAGGTVDRETGGPRGSEKPSLGGQEADDCGLGFLECSPTSRLETVSFL